MTLSSGLIAAVALIYMALLFAIAFYGDRRATPMHPKVRAWVYSLSLAVYCTSWTFFGAVGQAAEQLWSFLPIYLGPIIVLVFTPWVLQKMVMISKQENITSIADFIAARYGKSQTLAVVVALVCLVGVLPYIALQLKGIVLGVNLLSGAGAGANGTGAQDTALIVSLVLALFTILFGTRNLDVTEHHRGMVLAIAFESLVKLLAFLAVGIFVTYGLYDGFDDLLRKAEVAPQLEAFWQESVNWPSMLVQTFVAMLAILCLPRQFHVSVVENTEPQDLRLARWVFPAYLTLAALFLQMVIDGFPRLTADFFTNFPSRRAGQSGILSAWVGSLLVMLVTAMFAIPVGVASAIYLEEYARKNWFTDIIEINITNLAGVPSIVYGLLALGLFVYTFGFGQSILSAGLTLGLLILPIVIVSTREALRAIPQMVREGAYACGATKWQVCSDHLIPYGMPGILTGIIIGLSRAIGETAPIITIGALTFIAFLPPSPVGPEFPFLNFEWLKAPFTVMPIQIWL